MSKKQKTGRNYTSQPRSSVGKFLPRFDTQQAVRDQSDRILDDFYESGGVMGLDSQPAWSVKVRRDPDYMPLVMGGTEYIVRGGPFFNKPESMVGVCMAREISFPVAAVRVNVVDFGVPDRLEIQDGLVKALMLILGGAPVYVGCMGGRGRTGIMMALLAKVSFALDDIAALHDPVSYVRRTYNPHAVENDDQHKFVDEFDVTPVVAWLRVGMGRGIWAQEPVRPSLWGRLARWLQK